jgi:hypothetical protein
MEMFADRGKRKINGEKGRAAAARGRKARVSLGP